MAGQKNPFDVVRLKKEGLILPDSEFYELLSEGWNHLEPETVKQFYLAFVKIVSRQIRTKGVIRLPHLGDYAIVKTPPTRPRIRGRYSGVDMSENDSYALRFYPDRNLKKYFSEYINRDPKQMVDPREKLLNRKITGDEGKMSGC